jgi:hypothetical protein
MPNHETNAALIAAIADAIAATGFDALAREYRAEPAKRDRIERAMTRNIRRDVGEAQALAFHRLTAKARGIYFLGA